jgi:lysozyme family protein
MNKLSKYNDFIIEKEFQKIVYQIHQLVESTYTQEWDLTNYKDRINVGDEVEWDLTPKRSTKSLKDESPVEIEWSFDQKSKFQKFKDNISKFKNYLNEPDPEVEIEFKHPLINMVKEFLSKLKDKEEVKKYFLKILDEVKSLPYPLKKNLLIRISFIFLSYVSLSDITPPDVISKEPLMSEVKIELQKETPVKKEILNKKKEVKSLSKDGSKFEIAQVGVHKIEGVYTDDRDDKGNWTGNEVGSGMLLGTKFGIAAPTLVHYYDENDMGIPSQQDMMDLTYKTALDIYKKDYWEAQQLSNFKSQSLANVLYDGCVNQGPGATLTILTNSLEDINVDSTGVNTWNDFHEDLIDEVNELPKSKIKKLFHLIKNKRWEKYQLGKKKYQEGWKNRLDSITFNDDNSEQNQDIS